jgi:hypothetical protein
LSERHCGHAHATRRRLKRSLGLILLTMAMQRVWANRHLKPAADRPPPTGLDLRKPATLRCALPTCYGCGWR